MEPCAFCICDVHAVMEPCVFCICSVHAVTEPCTFCICNVHAILEPCAFCICGVHAVMELCAATFTLSWSPVHNASAAYMLSDPCALHLRCACCFGALCFLHPSRYLVAAKPAVNAGKNVFAGLVLVAGLVLWTLTAPSICCHRAFFRHIFLLAFMCVSKPFDGALLQTPRALRRHAHAWRGLSACRQRQAAPLHQLMQVGSRASRCLSNKGGQHRASPSHAIDAALPKVHNMKGLHLSITEARPCSPNLCPNIARVWPLEVLPGLALVSQGHVWSMSMACAHPFIGACKCFRSMMLLWNDMSPPGDLSVVALL